MNGAHCDVWLPGGHSVSQKSQEVSRLDQAAPSPALGQAQQARGARTAPLAPGQGALCCSSCSNFGGQGACSADTSQAWATLSVRFLLTSGLESLKLKTRPVRSRAGSGAHESEARGR